MNRYMIVVYFWRLPYEKKLKSAKYLTDLRLLDYQALEVDMA